MFSVIKYLLIDRYEKMIILGSDQENKLFMYVGGNYKGAEY